MDNGIDGPCYRLELNMIAEVTDPRLMTELQSLRNEPGKETALFGFDKAFPEVMQRFESLIKQINDQNLGFTLSPDGMRLSTQKR